MMKIGFIGGGKMAQSMAKGFISAGLTKGEHIVASCHPSDKQSVEAFTGMGGKSTFDNTEVVKDAEVVLISVKPHIIPEALCDITKKFSSMDKLFMSVAMGVTTKQLEKDLPKGSRVVRVMPNIPVMVGNGASVYTLGSAATEADAETTRTLMSAVGTCDPVSESLFDVVTGLSGSGPAYVFVLIEALADGGVKMGLPRDLAYKLASQTVMGAGKMVRETNEHPGKLKDDVTSPGGTTAAGLSFLESRGFRSAVQGAVEEACKRAMLVSKAS